MHFFSTRCVAFIASLICFCFFNLHLTAQHRESDGTPVSEKKSAFNGKLSVSRIGTITEAPGAMAAQNGYLYLGWSGGPNRQAFFSVWNIADISSPTWLYAIELRHSSYNVLSDIVPVGDYVYLYMDGTYLITLDVSSQDTALVVDSLLINPLADPVSLVRHGNYLVAYSDARNNGITFIDIQNPAKPKVVYSVPGQGGWSPGRLEPRVALNDSSIFFDDDGYLTRVKYAGFPAVATRDTLLANRHLVEDICLENNRLCAGYIDSIGVFDIAADPPRLEKTIPLYGDHWRIEVKNDHVLTTMLTPPARIVDLRSENQPDTVFQYFGTGSDAYFDAILYNDYWFISSTEEGIMVFKLNWDSTAAAEPPLQSPTGYSLSTHPQPLSTNGAITATLAEAGDMRIIVYDMFGRIVRTMNKSYQNAGVHEISFIRRGEPSGVYYCSLILSGKPMASGKMVLR